MLYQSARVSRANRAPIVGLRVSDEEETQGLDLSEMGMEAYPGDPMHEK